MLTRLTAAMIVILAVHLIPSGFSTSEIPGKLLLEFIRYYNPTDLLANGDDCEILGGKCDPYFQFCVGLKGDPYGCTFSQPTTSVYTNQNDIQGESRNDLKIPFTINLDNIVPNDFYISVTVREFDKYGITGAAIIGKFGMDVHRIPLQNATNALDESTEVVELPRIDQVVKKNSARLWIKVATMCNLFFFGEQCQTKCQETDKYTCAKDGKKMCRHGWFGKNCDNHDYCADKKNFCASNAVCKNEATEAKCYCNGGTGPECFAGYNFCANTPCLNGGECLLAEPSYVCNCVSGFTGNVCQVPASPCHSQPCKNGAQCYFQKNNGDYLCKCAHGFEGLQCEVATPSKMITSTEFIASINENQRFLNSPVMSEQLQQTTAIGGISWTIIIVCLAALLITIALIVGFYILRKRPTKPKKIIQENGVYEYEVPMLAPGADAQLYSIASDSDNGSGTFHPYVAVNMRPVVFRPPSQCENLYEECDPVGDPQCVSSDTFLPLERSSSLLEPPICMRDNLSTKGFNSRSSGLPAVPERLV